ncbi:CaiB/BaiF CoA transferase family protein [Pseudonocardia nigra]|uniref:CaiB/BaiF CoA transferase family protein n=1 Tax=Pseudonocardia nigra TaxID=1921578 RepID=UPI001C5F0A57|nr:CoA transferase [Pseudonocardia nigra]
MTPSFGALAGVRVLDVTQVMAGAYCSMLLADMGADVVKVEKPGTGDDTRRMGEFMPHGESPSFMAVNRNKRGIVVDLHDPRGVDVLRRLAAESDVLVENFRPGTMARLGLSYEDLCQVNPELIYCSVSGFGSTGPYSEQGGFDLIAQGMSGVMSFTGEPGRPPVKTGVPICDLNAGMFAAYGVLTAYIHRLRTGLGQYVDTSLLEAGIAYTVWETALLFAKGDVARPTGSAHRLSAPYEAFPTADGWLTIGAANQRNWERLCVAVGRSDLLIDERFANAGTRLAHRAELAEQLGTVLGTRSTAEWVDHLREAGVPCGPIYDIQQVYDDEHVRAREMLVEVEHPRAGRNQQIGVPVKLSVTPGRVHSPAPVLGQHTREVLTEAGLPEREVAELIAAGVVEQAAFEPIEAR